MTEFKIAVSTHHAQEKPNCQVEKNLVEFLNTKPELHKKHQTLNFTCFFKTLRDKYMSDMPII